MADRPSMLLASVATRLAIALVCSTLLWLAYLWATA